MSARWFLPLVTRLPQVHARDGRGRTGRAARVFSEWPVELSVEQKWAIAVDPDRARRRYEHAVDQRTLLRQTPARTPSSVP